MRLNWITVDQFVGDWLDETGHEGHFNVDEVEKFAQDEAERLVSGDVGKEYIVLLEIDNYTAELPINFQREVQAAYNIYPRKPVLRQEVSEFTQPIFDGTGCELKINIECPKCHKEQCSCSVPVVEVEADYLYQIANPQHHTAYWNHFHHYVNLTEYPDDRRCGYHPQFRLMYPKINDFWNMEYNLSQCVHFEVDNEISYIIDDRNIVVNFEKGQVLVNYIGLRLDENGRSLIPSDPDAIDAIVKYVEMKFAKSDYRTTKKRDELVYYQLIKEEYKEAHDKAVRKLRRRTPNEISRLFRNIMRKQDFVSNRSNLNRPMREYKQIPNQTSGRIWDK